MFNFGFPSRMKSISRSGQSSFPFYWHLSCFLTFAKVDETKSCKWQYSSEGYSSNVLAEELRSKVKQVPMLKNEINAIYAEIRETCSLLRYLLILRTGHVGKTSKLVYKKFDVEEYINNISSYQHSFFQKLVLCLGLNFAIPQAVTAIGC